MEKRVAIIGAGASGLTAIKCCLDEGIHPVCFERTDDIGGLWNYTETIREDQACVMKSTVINSSKEMMAFSDFPIPSEFPNYMHNTKMMEYFRMYVDNFDLMKYIKFNTSVLSLRQTDDFSSTGQWVLKTQNVAPDASTGDITAQVFDAVMLCTGHHANKRETNFPGQETFKGKIVHTHDYKDHRGYEGKRVVVIGIGNSGGDVAVELGRIATQVYLSTRRGGWVLNRVGWNGLPVDMIGIRRFNQTLSNILGWNVLNSIFERETNQRFDHKTYGLRPNHRLLSQHPMINDDLANRIICGSVIIKPDIKQINGNDIEFNDGTIVKNIDVIITAIGYQFGFPFLDEKVIKVQDNVVELYKYAFPPNQPHHTLAVIGCVQPWGSVIPISELQSRWAVRVFKGTTNLPSKQDMWMDIQMKQNTMKHRYVDSPRHTIQVDWIPFMDEIASQLGCKPNIKQLFLSDPKLAINCIFGPCTPYQYRIHGSNPWNGARDAILTTWDRMYQPLKTRPVEEEKVSVWSYLIKIMFVIFLAVLIKLFFY